MSIARELGGLGGRCLGPDGPRMRPVGEYLAFPMVSGGVSHCRLVPVSRLQWVLVDVGADLPRRPTWWHFGIAVCSDSLHATIRWSLIASDRQIGDPN